MLTKIDAAAIARMTALRQAASHSIPPRSSAKPAAAPRTPPRAAPKRAAPTVRKQPTDPYLMTAGELRATGWTPEKLLRNGFDVREMRRRGLIAF